MKLYGIKMTFYWSNFEGTKVESVLRVLYKTKEIAESKIESEILRIKNTENPFYGKPLNIKAVMIDFEVED